MLSPKNQTNKQTPMRDLVKAFSMVVIRGLPLVWDWGDFSASNMFAMQAWRPQFNTQYLWKITTGLCGAFSTLWRAKTGGYLMVRALHVLRQSRSTKHKAFSISSSPFTPVSLQYFVTNTALAVEGNEDEKWIHLHCSCLIYLHFGCNWPWRAHFYEEG